MSILIKGMAMPKNCLLCPFCVPEADEDNGEMCVISGQFPLVNKEERSCECPLVLVPPHGNLIDRDVAKAQLKGEGIRVSKLSVMAVLNNAEVIIKAEPTCNDCKYSLQNCKDKSICCEMEDGLCDEYEKENC